VTTKTDGKITDKMRLDKIDSMAKFMGKKYRRKPSIILMGSGDLFVGSTGHLNGFNRKYGKTTVRQAIDATIRVSRRRKA
jgi:hypothetical protein